MGSSRPFGVTLLSVIQILSGLTLLIDSLVASAYSSWASSVEGRQRLDEVFPQRVAESIAGILFLLSVIYLALGISSLLLARGYYKGHESARRRGRRVAALVIVFAFLGAFLFARMLPERLDIHVSWWSILFNFAVILYLGRPSAVSYFDAQRGR